MVLWIFGALFCGNFLLISLFATENVYDEYKFVEITARHKRDLQLLSQLYTEDNVDFVRKARSIGQKAVIFANPSDFSIISQKLQNAGANFESKDVSFDTNDREKRSIATAPLQYQQKTMKTGTMNNYTLDEYHDLSEQMAFIESIAQRNPSFVKMGTMGKSFQGKSIQYLKIGYPINQTKPIFFIDAGIHAREWIAPAVALWITNELTNSTKYASLLRQIDIIIAPNLNPDGYTHTRKGYRMWRKNLTPQPNQCFGVDLNRNFPFYYGFSGTESNSCSEIYKGPKAASEPETQALKNFLDNNKQQIKAYITLHSYGQNWVYPWGYAVKTYPPDVQDLIDLGNAAQKAIAQVRGTQYSVENSADGMYPAAGASDDYAKSLGIKYVYTVELAPSEDDLRYDFNLPANQILSTSTEVFQGILVVARKVAQQYAD